MRILQAMAGAERGGAESYFESLVAALHRAGVDQRVVIRRNPERAARLRAAGLAPVQLPFGGPLEIFTAMALRAQLGRYRPDVVVTWMSRASGKMPRTSAFQIGRLGGYYDLKYFARCDLLVCNTLDLVDYCIDAGWPRRRVRYLPNFVNLTPRAAEDRAAHDTPQAAPLLLAMGRLHENKAFDVLLRALALLPDCWLWLAGEGVLQAELAALAAELGVAGRVRFLGWRDDKEALLAAADLVVVPSRVEPFGNVILDAWAAERPLVAAAAAGPAAHATDGEDALLVPIDDAAALAAAVRRVLDEPALRSRLVEGGRRSHEADYTEAAITRRWLDLMKATAR
ncbi:MAG: glycosyltransferase [Sneathiellaceae bacterium]